MRLYDSVYSGGLTPSLQKQMAEIIILPSGQRWEDSSGSGSCSVKNRGHSRVWGVQHCSCMHTMMLWGNLSARTYDADKMFCTP